MMSPAQIRTNTSSLPVQRLRALLCLLAAFCFAFPLSAQTVSVADISFLEGDGGPTVRNFTVSLSVVDSDAVTVTYQTHDGTATAGSDYESAAGTVTIPANTLTASIPVTIIGDMTVEGDETFTLELTGVEPSPWILGTAIATATILDDDVTISIADASSVESAVSVTTTVSLGHASPFTVTVDYTTVDDTATAGDDYVAASGTVTFAPGEMEQEISIDLINDNDVEGTEQFFIQLSDATNAIFSDNEATITLTDDFEASEDFGVLIYRLAVRGRAYGVGAGPIVGNGYLVIDIRGDEITSLISYVNGSASVQQWNQVHAWDESGTGYETDLGNRDLVVLVSAGDDFSSAYSYADMIGVTLANGPFELGGVESDVALSLSGELRAGNGTDTEESFTVAQLAARYQHALTVEANQDQDAHNAVVAELAQALGINLITSSVQASASVSPAAAIASDAVALYVLRSSTLIAGEGTVQRESRTSFVAIDFATQTIESLTLLPNRTYEREIWSPDSAVWYAFTIGNASYSFFATEEETIGLESSEHEYTVLYGRNISSTLGSQSPQIVPGSLTGTRYNHVVADDPQGDGLYSKTNLGGRILGATISVNQNAWTTSQTIDWIIDLYKLQSAD